MHALTALTKHVYYGKIMMGAAYSLNTRQTNRKWCISYECLMRKKPGLFHVVKIPQFACIQIVSA